MRWPAGRRAAAGGRADRLSAPAALACAAVLAAFAAAGCHRHVSPSPAPAPSPPVLGTIDVQLASPDEGDQAPPIDPQVVRGAVRAHLLGTGLFATASSADAAAPVRADAVVRIAAETVEVESAGEARARVWLSLTCRPPDAPGAFSVALDGSGSERYPIRSKPAGARRRGSEPVAAAGPAAETAVVLRIAGDLIDGFAARRRLHDGPAEAVHAALMADGGELREEAIRAAGERKLSGEGSALLRLLDDSDERTRDAALGALIALGDRRAVSALTRSRSLRDRREMRKIIEAVAILGGQEADDYLSFVAASHDDDDIRAAAAAARERMLRREGAGSNPAH
jgi:hypothetical protein